MGIVGASGFTGAELLRLLAEHPQLELRVATGDSKAGTRVAELYPSLAAAYPNPFSESVTLAFELPEAQTVTLTVYDMLGRRVAVLASGEHDAGYHAVRFDGRDLSAGVYVYRLVLPGHIFSRRMTLVH